VPNMRWPPRGSPLTFLSVQGGPHEVYLSTSTCPPTETTARRGRRGWAPSGHGRSRRHREEVVLLRSGAFVCVAVDLAVRGVHASGKERGLARDFDHSCPVSDPELSIGGRGKRRWRRDHFDGRGPGWETGPFGRPGVLTALRVRHRTGDFDRSLATAQGDSDGEQERQREAADLLCHVVSMSRRATLA
jgi:hypothetical protein